MDEKVEIPRGLVRTWKAVWFGGLSVIPIFVFGWWVGHNSARIETHIDRVEVPYPDECVDALFRLSETEDVQTLKCTHPAQRGEFKNITFHVDSLASHTVPYLMCTCPHGQLDLDGGAK